MAKFTSSSKARPPPPWPSPSGSALLNSPADSILGIGCPSSDIAGQMDRTLTHELINSRGSGAALDLAKPFLLVIFHPTTTEYGGERAQMEALLAALNDVRQQTVLLWPNIDA